MFAIPAISTLGRLEIPVAMHYLAGSILTLALPLGVLIVVALWYVLMWRGGMGER
jgi:hypothetical protein